MEHSLTWGPTLSRHEALHRGHSHMLQVLIWPGLSLEGRGMLSLLVRIIDPPGAADQADRSGVVVRSSAGWSIHQYCVSLFDELGGHQHPATSVLVLDLILVIATVTRGWWGQWQGELGGQGGGHKPILLSHQHFFTFILRHVSLITEFLSILLRSQESGLNISWNAFTWHTGGMQVMNARLSFSSTQFVCYARSCRYCWAFEYCIPLWFYFQH